MFGAAGADQSDSQLVADEPAAAARKGRRAIDKAYLDYWLLLAESHLTRRLFAGMPKSIAAFRKDDTSALARQQID